MNEGGYCTLDKTTPVMVSSIKDIELEARFFIVNGQVITGSSYRSFGRQVMYQRVEDNNPVMHPMLEFAQKMVDLWAPDVAFVMDVAQINGEYRIIEINCFNNAGFYACNMRSVVKALEHL